MTIKKKPHPLMLCKWPGAQRDFSLNQVNMSLFLFQFYDGKFGFSPSTLLERLRHRICSFRSCGLTGRDFNRGLSRTLLAGPYQTSCVTLTHFPNPSASHSISY